MVKLMGGKMGREEERSIRIRTQETGRQLGNGFFLNNKKKALGDFRLIAASRNKSCVLNYSVVVEKKP